MEEQHNEAKVINFTERLRERIAGEPEPDIKTPLPEFISPSDIDGLTDDQLEQMLNVMRVRRLQSTMVYEQTLRDKDTVTQGKARDMLEQKCAQVYKEMDGAFKKLEKLELRVNELRALRLQAGLSW